jgi:CRP/FNR family transcriptional regulator, nitrogen oxide reductase regulator
VASHLLRLPATEIPLVERPKEQILPIKLDKSRWQARRSQNGRMDRADGHDQSARMLYKCCEDPALDFRIACVKTAPLFRGLSESESHEIATAAQELPFSHRETIFRQDDPVRFVYVVASGTVKVTQLSEGGKEVILRVDRRGSLIDDLTGALQVYASSAHAIHSCSVLAWDVAVFEDCVERFPVMHRNTTRIMLGRLRMLEERFCDVTTQRVPQRLARLLIHLAGQSTQGALDPISLSREELSQMTGTTLFTVSRLLSLWAELDILTVDRKAVVIEDLAHLLRIAAAAAA